MPPDDKVNILVVDDLPEKLLVLDTVLGELGENLIVARSGEEALLQVLRYEFAVILLDVNMPSMDGYETAALIRNRKRSAHTPIIFITSYADELHKAQGYSLGAVDYILSPVNPEILRTKVRVFVDLFRMTQQAKRHADERVALMRAQADRDVAQAAREAAEAAHRRSSFLAETSAMLASLLDQDARVRDLARLCVPFLADLSAVTLAGPRGSVGRTELAWSSVTTGTVSIASLEAAALPEALLDAIRKVLETGRMERIEGRMLPQGSHSSRKGAVTAGPPFALQSALILPMRARNQLLGILTLALGPSNRRFGPAEILLGEDLAGRAAVFLDNARLYRDIQESDARKNEFLAMLAHELRNPLAAIRGAVQILGLSELSPDKISWARAIIDRQVNQLVRLVDDLLDVARITQGKIRLHMEPVELSSVVDLAVELSNPIIESRRHCLSVSCPNGPLWVRGDATRLAQVLANLLNNAAKYTDEGGQIWLSVEREQERALLRVRDNGIGIPEHMVTCIFDPFTQVNRSLDRSQGGLGIGLTLVRHLVEMHGGSVSVTSKGPNQGSEFLVCLPLLLEAPVPQTAASQSQTVASAQRRVLVVDDNRDIAESLAIILSENGHEVRMAHDGPTALEVAQAFGPQVVLLDIGLPGIDGYGVARRMRKLPELDGALLVALTGYGQPEERRRAEEAGFDIHLVKPVDLQTVIELMNRTATSPELKDPNDGQL